VINQCTYSIAVINGGRMGGTWRWEVGIEPSCSIEIEPLYSIEIEPLCSWK
jgi:hypothetical protein